MTPHSARSSTGPAGAALTWVGHATVLIELDGVRILTDPALRERMGFLARTAPPVSPEVCEDIDAVVLSHLHADHVDLRSLRRLGSATPVFAPRGAGAWLARRGLRAVHELERGEAARVGGVRIRATRAVHGGSRYPFGASSDPMGVLVEGSRTVYFAGDTDLFPEMEGMAASIDAALLPIWGWGSRVGPGHLDPARAAEAAARLSPRLTIPIHWGTFAPTWAARRARDSRAPAREFGELMARTAPGSQVRVLDPGERVELPRVPIVEDVGGTPR